MSVLTQWPDWAGPLAWTVATIGGAYAVGLAARAIVGLRLARLAAGATGNWDEVLRSEVARRIPFWSLLIGAFLSLAHWHLSTKADQTATELISAMGVASVTFALAAVATRLVVAYGPRTSPSAPVSGLTQNIVRIVITVIGVLVIVRSSFGYDISAILTAFGIGGLAVALALQEPLSNLFAGVFVSIAGQIRIGDYVKLDSGAEGYLVDFNWRSARLRQLSDNVIVVPNSKLAQAIVTNYSLPSSEMGIGVDVTVDRGADLPKIERIATEVAESVMKEVAGGVPGTDVSVRFQSFADTGIRFSVGLRVRHFVDQFLVKHELIKRLQARFVAEGVRFR